MLRVLLCLSLTALVGCATPAPAPGEGTSLYYFQENDKYGFKNAAGVVVVPAIYDDVRKFAYGRAPVNRGAVRELSGLKDGGEWGYIDTNGGVVVPLTLRYAREFSDGLAAVWDRSGARYIDPWGRTVIVAATDTVGDFSEGLAPVYVDRSAEGKDWLTRFIDKTGKAAFVVEGYAHEFHEGLAAITLTTSERGDESCAGFINARGDLVIAPRFAEVSVFSEGLAAVRAAKNSVYGKSGSWGYIDATGRYAIESRFNEAHQFRFGMAIVHEGGEFEVQEDVPSAWRGGQWLLIDRRGEALTRAAAYLECQKLAAQLRERGR
jgi:hypothetical protein